jgi:hypothetical protein
VELCQLTASALLPYQTVLQDLQDPQAPLVNQDSPERQDNPEMTEPQERLLSHAHHKILLAKAAQLDRQDHPDPMGKLDRQVQMDSQEHQDKEAARDPQAHPDLLEMLVQADSQEPQDSPELQDKTELARPRLQDPRDQAELQDPPDHQGQTATQAKLAAKDRQGPRDRTETPELQEAMANQGKQEAPDCPAQTPLIAHAHLAPPSSCTANRVAQEQFPELHRTTAILFLSLFVVEKMRKDCLSRRFK